MYEVWGWGGVGGVRDVHLHLEVWACLMKVWGCLAVWCPGEVTACSGLGATRGSDAGAVCDDVHERAAM